MTNRPSPAPFGKQTSHGPSFLRWAGSKRQTLSVLQGIVPEPARHYVEPFAGSAALFFATRPKAGTLADLNGHLVNAMKQVRRAPRRIHERVSSIHRDEKTYYRCRDRFNALEAHGEEAAALFIYLNRNCFNGLWRTNQRGLFNVPYGGGDMGDVPPVTLFLACASALRGIDVMHQDYRKTISGLDERHFVYADPPYFTANERTFVEYGAKSFGLADLEDLVRLLRAASQRGAMIALTYSGAMPIDELTRTWFQTKFEVTRNVGGFTGTRRKHGEVLYTNFRPRGVKSV